MASVMWAAPSELEKTFPFAVKSRERADELARIPVPPHWLLAFVPPLFPCSVHVNEIPRCGKRSGSCTGRWFGSLPDVAGLCVASPVVTPLKLKADKRQMWRP